MSQITVQGGHGSRRSEKVKYMLINERLSCSCHGFWHSRPQRPRSFWSAPGIATSGQVQHRKSAFHGLPIKSDKSDWLRIRNEYSVHAQKIGSGKRSRFLVLTKRSAASGDENGVLEANENYPGNHGIYGSADRNLGRIPRLFRNLLTFAWRWSVGLVASLYFFYSGRYL